jgi:hypothetical protein
MSATALAAIHRKSSLHAAPEFAQAQRALGRKIIEATLNTRIASICST